MRAGHKTKNAKGCGPQNKMQKVLPPEISGRSLDHQWSVPGWCVGQLSWALLGAESQQTLCELFAFKGVGGGARRVVRSEWLLARKGERVGVPALPGSPLFGRSVPADRRLLLARRTQGGEQLPPTKRVPSPGRGLAVELRAGHARVGGRGRGLCDVVFLPIAVWSLLSE